jgi:hypothetical protein
MTETGIETDKTQFSVFRDIQSCPYDIINTVTCMGVTYMTGFGLDAWIYCTLYIHTGTTGNTELSLFYRSTRTRILGLH